MLQPALGASLKVVKDLNLFEKWHQQGNVALTFEELAELVSCDGLLLRKAVQCILACHTFSASDVSNSTKSLRPDRLIRHLAANNVLEEVGPGSIQADCFLARLTSADLWGVD